MSRIKNVSAGVSRLRNEIDVDAYEQEANLVAASRALASLTAVRRLIARLRLEALRSHHMIGELDTPSRQVEACLDCGTARGAPNAVEPGRVNRRP